MGPPVLGELCKSRIEFILSVDGSVLTLGASESGFHHDEELSLEGKRSHTWPGLEKVRGRTQEMHTYRDPRPKHWRGCITLLWSHAGPYRNHGVHA